jgi:hypothetical protein
MAPDRRRPLVLLGVLAVLVIVYIWTRQSDSTPAASGGRAQAIPINPGGAIADVPEVKLDALNAARTGLEDQRRNPFRLQPPAPPTEPPRPAPRVTPPVAPIDPSVPPPPPPPPPITLKFIGLVQAASRGGRLAVLSDGRFVYYGREGDIIDGRYRVVRIGDESIELEYADGRGKQTIRLSGS